MITIHLDNLKFYAYHGVLDEEKIIGNEYEVNAEIKYHEEEAQITSLSATVNYADIFLIIQKRMQLPSQLLETIVMDIGNEIHQKYDHLQSIHIFLKKLYPPIENIQGAVGVSWNKEF